MTKALTVDSPAEEMTVDEGGGDLSLIYIIL